MLVRRLAKPDVVVDGIFAMRHGFDSHDALVRHLRRRVAAKLAERPLISGFRRNRQFSFENDLRKRRHFEIDSPALHHLDGLADKPAGNV